MVDGKPIETEEVVEEPEDVSTHSDGEPVPVICGGTRVVKKNVKIKRVVRIVDGKEVVEEQRSETPEEVLEYPAGTGSDQPLTLPISQDIESIPSDAVQSPETPVQQARVIRQLRIVDGQPVVSEEILEGAENIPSDTSVLEKRNIQVHAVRRRMKVIRRVQIIDGERVVTEEVVEEPETEFGMPEDGSGVTVTDMTPFPLPQAEASDIPSPSTVVPAQWKEETYPSGPSISKQEEKITEETYKITEVMSKEPPTTERPQEPFPAPVSSFPIPSPVADVKPEDVKDTTEIWSETVYTKSSVDDSPKEPIPDTAGQAPVLPEQPAYHEPEEDFEPYPQPGDSQVEEPWEEIAHDLIGVTREISLTTDGDSREVKDSEDQKTKAFPSPQDLTVRAEDLKPVSKERRSSAGEPFPTFKRRDSGVAELCKIFESPKKSYDAPVYQRPKPVVTREKIQDTPIPFKSMEIPAWPPSKEKDSAVKPFPRPIGDVPLPSYKDSTVPRDPVTGCRIFLGEKYTLIPRDQQMEKITDMPSGAPAAPAPSPDFPERREDLEPFARPFEFGGDFRFPEYVRQKSETEGELQTPTQPQTPSWEERLYQKHVDSLTPTSIPQTSETAPGLPERGMAPPVDARPQFPSPQESYPYPVTSEEIQRVTDIRSPQLWATGHYQQPTSTEERQHIPQDESTPMLPPTYAELAAKMVASFPTPGVAPVRDGKEPPQYAEREERKKDEVFPLPLVSQTEETLRDVTSVSVWPEKIYSRVEVMEGEEKLSPEGDVKAPTSPLPAKSPEFVTKEAAFPVPVGQFPVPTQGKDDEPREGERPSELFKDVLYIHEPTDEEPRILSDKEGGDKPAPKSPEFKEEVIGTPVAPFPEPGKPSTLPKDEDKFPAPVISLADEPRDVISTTKWTEEQYARSEVTVKDTNIPQDDSTAKLPPIPLKAPPTPKDDIPFSQPVGEFPEPTEKPDDRPSVPASQIHKETVYERPSDVVETKGIEEHKELQLPSKESPKYEEVDVAKEAEPFPEPKVLVPKTEKVEIVEELSKPQELPFTLPEFKETPGKKIIEAFPEPVTVQTQETPQDVISVSQWMEEEFYPTKEVVVQDRTLKEKERTEELPDIPVKAPEDKPVIAAFPVPAAEFPVPLQEAGEPKEGLKTQVFTEVVYKTPEVIGDSNLEIEEDIWEEAVSDIPDFEKIDDVKIQAPFPVPVSDIEIVGMKPPVYEDSDEDKFEEFPEPTSGIPEDAPEDVSTVSPWKDELYKKGEPVEVDRIPQVTQDVTVLPLPMKVPEEKTQEEGFPDPDTQYPRPVDGISEPTAGPDAVKVFSEVVYTEVVKTEKPEAIEEPEEHPAVQPPVYEESELVPSEPFPAVSVQGPAIESIEEIIRPEETTTIRKIIRRIIKKITMVDGKPVETEEVVEEPEEVEGTPGESGITEIITEPEEVITTHRIIRRRIIKKIIMVDGKPVETEEVVEEPEEISEEMLQGIPADSVITETVTEPDEVTTTTVRRIIRKRIIKKIVMIDGKPVETEEVIEEPEEISEETVEGTPEELVITETVTEPEEVITTHRSIRRRIIKKIVMIDGKPVETEEVIEEPEDVSGEMVQSLPTDSVVTETVTEPEVTTTHRIVRRRIIKKIIMIDGKPVETEEVVEEPEEVTGELVEATPGESVITETITEPDEVTTTTVRRIIRKRIIKKIVMIDGKPVETEEVIEEPEEVSEEMLEGMPGESVTTETFTEPEE
ncbi:titin-like, partial [Penaeus japonicus]|uniref:titin-like n=1 Tax=Penaeus japonicus TaxID=27405 RepID=UPI001C710BAE